MSTILVNETGNLEATAYASSGSVLRGRLITWTSLDPDVASVDSEGIVHALSAGTATIQAVVDGVTGTASITVAMPPAIELSASAVGFSSPFGGSPTAPQSLTVRASDGSPVSGLSASIAATTAGEWVEVELSSAETPATLAVRTLPAALPAGVHLATVTVTATSPGVLPATLEVTLRVGEALPEIVVDPSSLSLAADQGQAPPPPRSIGITNGGGGILTGLRFSTEYSASSGSGWIVASLDRTSAPAVLTVGVNPAGLSPGVYDAEIEIEAGSAPGASAAVQVRFRYGEPPPEIELGTRDLIWEVLEGTLTIASQNVSVTNRGSGVLGSLSARVRYADDGPSGWLSAGVNPSVAPAALQVSVLNPGFAPGEYRAVIDVESPSAINSPQSVAVLLRIRPRPSLDRSTVTAAPTSIPADGVSSSLITVRLLDSNGSPITSGGHAVTMATTAGSLGPVQSSGGGVYTAQLTAPNRTGTATVSARVSGSSLVRTATVTFVPPPNASTSTLSASPTTIVANGVSTSSITLQLRDVDGNVAPTNAIVAFTTTAGTLGPVTNQGSGRYVVSLRSTTALTVANVTATVGGSAFVGPVSVGFVAGPPARIELTGPEKATHLLPSGPLTITIVDAFGHPTTSATAERFTLSHDGTLGLFTPPSPVTIPAGAQSTSFSFTNLSGGKSRTVTATWSGGGPTPLGSASHRIKY